MYDSRYKNTWRILKNVINKNGPQISLYYNCFSHRGTKITNFDQTADIFNEYFVSVGPSLAKSINVVKKDPTDYLKGNHTVSMFLHGTDGKEKYNVIL